MEVGSRKTIPSFPMNSVNVKKQCKPKYGKNCNDKLIPRIKGKKGVIQDAAPITADISHKNVDKPRGPDAKAMRNKDGTRTKKGRKSYYGYKLHTKTDRDYVLIRDLETTPVSVHDNQIDLSQPGEVVYRDRR